VNRYYIAGVSLVGLVVLATAAFLAVRADEAMAHCQVPCGIYDDAARIARLKEDATTIGKAIEQINELAGKHDARALNQATRWILTKEEHASHIIEVLSEYFLTQRVTPVAPGAEGYEAYVKKLVDHHGVMVAAMKTKQDADPATVERLNEAIAALGRHY